jgi:hypothetical protein
VTGRASLHSSDYGAHDHTSGTPVSNFTRNNKVYSLNKKSDRDKDGIACEKR